MSEVLNWSASDDVNVDLFPENMAYSAVNDSGRAIQGAVARWNKDISGAITSTGSGNAFVLTTNTDWGSYTSGMTLRFKSHRTITGAPTLNVNGMGAKSIRDRNGELLSAGLIVSGQFVTVTYDQTNGYFRATEIYIDDPRQLWISVTQYGATGDGVTDDTTAFAQAVTAAATAGGGTIYAPAGTYSTTGISLADGVNFVGDGPGVTILLQKGTNGIDTISDYWNNINVEGFTLQYDHASPSQSHIGLLVDSCEGCTFRRIRFEGYNTSTGAGSNDGQTAIALKPTNSTAGQKNTIMNQFSDIWIEDARIGVYYEGVTGTGTFDQATIHDTTATAGNVITGNVWTNIVMRNITYRGIQAVKWADSEKWTNPYIKVTEDNAICINLGSDANYFTQIDRFRITNPNLESHAPNASTTSGLRIGPGGFRHEVVGIVSDGDWDSGAGNNFFDVSGAQSYHITAEAQGDGSNYANGEFYKGSMTLKTGSVTFGAADTVKTVDLNTSNHNFLARAPITGEIQLTPRTDWGNTTKWWISAQGQGSFEVTLDQAPGSTFTLGFLVQLVEV